MVRHRLAIMGVAHGPERRCAAYARPAARAQRAARRPRRYERAPFHSITSSARASSVGEMVRPRALAVNTLITRSNLVAARLGCLHYVERCTHASVESIIGS